MHWVGGSQLTCLSQADHHYGHLASPSTRSVGPRCKYIKRTLAPQTETNRTFVLLLLGQSVIFCLVLCLAICIAVCLYCALTFIPAFLYPANSASFVRFSIYIVSKNYCHLLEIVQEDNSSTDHVGLCERVPC